MVSDYFQIRNELRGAGDALILSRYLKPMIENGAYRPRHLEEDADVFNKNPSNVFTSENPSFVIVKPKTESCGKTDGCDFGCWRIVARDKLIKNEETGTLLGFKKILKFCEKTRAREYKRSWVMEEYRLPSKWNPKQDHVICKIQLLFQTEIGYLLSKQFSYSSDPLPETLSLPAYGVCLGEKEGSHYLQHLIDYGNRWPSYVTNDVYRMHPSALVNPRDERFARTGLCIFANRREASGYSDGCVSGVGCWRVMEDDKPIRSITVMDEVFGFRRVFEFREREECNVFVTRNGEQVLLAWIMEEYRLVEEAMKDKVLCVIKLRW